MKKLKAFLSDKWAMFERFLKTKVMPHVEKANPVLGGLAVAAIFVVGVTLFVAFVVAVIAGVLAIKVLVPGMIVGFFAWFAWTYMQLGLTYFPDLAPVYYTIPYWHFAFGFAALVAIWRVIRKKPVEPKVTKVPGKTVK